MRDGINSYALRKERVSMRNIWWTGSVRMHKFNRDTDATRTFILICNDSDLPVFGEDRKYRFSIDTVCMHHCRTSCMLELKYRFIYSLFSSFIFRFDMYNRKEMFVQLLPPGN